MGDFNSLLELLQQIRFTPAADRPLNPTFFLILKFFNDLVISLIPGLRLETVNLASQIQSG